jgi:K+-transporting ATPase KdpF subunit
MRRTARVEGASDGFRFRWPDRRVLRLVGGTDPILRQPDGQGRQVMNWVYWLSGAATLGILIYLIVALFKPEYFE